MGSEIVSRRVSFNGFGDISLVASWAYNSGNFGLRSVDDAAIKILYGVEMGLPALQALTGLNLVQGKVTLSYVLIGSLIKRSGRYDYTVPVWDENECKIQFCENGKPIGVSHFTIADAKRAGLLRSGGGWDKYPKAMVFARAMTQGARAYCADVFGGPVYDPSELSNADIEIASEAQLKVSQPSPVTHVTPDTKDATKAVSDVVDVEPVANTAVREKLVVVPAPVEKQVHPLRIVLTELMGTNKDKMRNGVVKVYEVAARYSLVDNSAADEKQMYLQLVKVMDAGKLSVADVADILRSDDAVIVQDDESEVESDGIMAGAE